MSFFVDTSTPAEKFAQLALYQVQTTFRLFSGGLTRLFNEIWTNSDQTNLSPDKAWASLGVNAVQFRTAYLAAAAFINANNSGLMPSEPAGWTVTNNQDGTVTCVAS